MNKWCVVFYHAIDNNVFETCLKTLRMVSDCHIVVFTDDVPSDLREDWTEQYGVIWKVVSKEEVEGKRAAFKVKSLNDFVKELADGDMVMAADADLYFLEDPFTAFDGLDFDVGLTTRPYEYPPVPINAGVYFYRMSPKLNEFLRFNTQQVYESTWDTYHQFRIKCGHVGFGLDWSVGQDFWNVVWLNQVFIHKKFGIKVVDVGSQYNFHTGELNNKKSRDQFLRAILDKKAPVFHLKSDFKSLIYEGVLDDVVTHHPRGPAFWQ